MVPSAFYSLHIISKLSYLFALVFLTSFNKISGTRDRGRGGRSCSPTQVLDSQLSEPQLSDCSDYLNSNSITILLNLLALSELPPVAQCLKKEGSLCIRDIS